MGYIDGDDFINGAILSFQEANRMKNNWRGAAVPANFQPGMIYSDLIDRTWIRGAAALAELWSKNSGIALTNLAKNAGFGVWSNAGANKGLGAMPYDAGSVAGPAIGVLCTGATSGATGYVISYTITGGTFGANNAVGILQLGGCLGRFNDNEIVNYAGGSITVNTPVAGVGTDLLQNGEFQAATTGWTAVNCALASVAGGSVGNCLQITRVGAAPNRAYQNQPTALTIGKLYCLRVGVMSGTSGNEAFLIQVTDAAAGGGNVQGSKAGVSAGGWVFYDIYFEATAVYVSICLDKNTATAGTMFFDEATLYEITPLCIAADALAPDGWTKDTTPDIYREHNGANTKDGSFYALKIVPTAAADFVAFPSWTASALIEWYRRFAGRTVTFGGWAKTATISHARLGIWDGAVWTYSPYHTGGGTYEWLEVTRTFPTGATQAYFAIFADMGPSMPGTTIIYFSQPMLAFASVLGQGNYQPREDVIFFETGINDRIYNATAGYSTFGPIALNLEANSEGKIPKGAESLYVNATGNDSGSAAGVALLYLRKDVAAGTQYCVPVSGLTNEIGRAHV